MISGTVQHSVHKFVGELIVRLQWECRRKVDYEQCVCIMFTDQHRWTMSMTSGIAIVGH